MAADARHAPPPGLDPGADLLPVIPGSSPGRGKGPSSASAVARPQIPPQELEKIDSAPGQIAPGPAAQDPLAPLQRGEGRGEGLGRLAADARHAPPPGLDPGADLLPVIPGSSPGRGKGPSSASAVARPQIPPQELEKIDSAPGQIAPSPAAQAPLVPLQRGEGRGEGPGRLAADARPAPPAGLDPGADLLPVIPGSSPGRGKGPSSASADGDRPQVPLQAPENIESTPGNGPDGPDLSFWGPPVRIAVPTPTGTRFVNVRATRNGMMVC